MRDKPVALNHLFVVYSLVMLEYFYNAIVLYFLINANGGKLEHFFTVGEIFLILTRTYTQVLVHAL